MTHIAIENGPVEIVSFPIKIVIVYQVVPHRAVAEVSKIGNL